VRAGYVAIIVVIAFFTILVCCSRRDWIKLHRKRIFAGTVILAMLALVILPGSFLSDTFLSSFDLANDTNIKMRLHTWKQAIQIIGDNPLLGVGLGNYEIVSWVYLDETQEELIQESHTRVYRTHNDYLNLRCELGLVGFSIFFSFLSL
jgi:O-antigen ligase